MAIDDGTYPPDSPMVPLGAEFVPKKDYSDEQLTRLILAYDFDAKPEDIAETIRIWRSEQRP